MKRHPAWLAVGLLLAVVLACSLSKNSNNRNANENDNRNRNTNRAANAPVPNRPANADVYVDQINMAKDINGDPGEDTTVFAPGDRTIHCVIMLNKAKGGTKVKFDWMAVDVAELGNSEIKSIDYTTRPFENKIHAHLTLQRDWPKGSYRVDVNVNGNLDKQIDFTVE